MNGIFSSFLSNIRCTSKAAKSAIVSMLSLVFICSAMGSHADAPGQIKIDLPNSSVDGSFVVRIQQKQPEDNSQVELWRSVNNSEFKLITTQSSMSEVAQNVSANGDYTYKVLVVSEHNGQKQVDAVSNTETIQVSLRYPQLTAISSDF